jgi:iron complex transport system permease protein
MSAPATTAPVSAPIPSRGFVETTRRRRLWAWLASCALLLLTCVLSLCVGTESVSLSTVWSALTDYTDTGDEWIVRDLRVPRTALGLVIGVALGLAGALIQAVSRNPLADTQILGINSGASLSVVCAIAFLGLHDVRVYLWFAFLGAAAAMVLVHLVGSAGHGQATPVRMLLAGVAVGAIMEGISFSVLLGHPRAFDSMRFWDTGALDGRPLSIAATVTPFVLLGALLCLGVSRSLNAVALGDDLATSMGGNLARTHVLSLVAVTLLAGAAVAGAGPIGFVGLMVPHAVRRLTGPDWRWILAFTPVVAPTILLLADVLGRVVVRPAELPAGIVTAFIGAPALVWLIRRERGAAR